MVKAGFDDALIIEKVGNSKCQLTLRPML